MRFRFDSLKDVTMRPKLRTWINVDEPSIGSMQIEHESGCSLEQAIERTRLAACAPSLRDALSVMVLDGRIREWLIQNDPKALEQARAALDMADGKMVVT